MDCFISGNGLFIFGKGFVYLLKFRGPYFFMLEIRSTFARK